MKKLVTCTCISVSFLFFVVFSVFAQTERLDYKKIDYIDVPQAQSGEFINMIEKSLKPSYQKLAENGEIKSWKLYKVNFPGGDKSSYSFVSIVTATDMRAFENNFSNTFPVYYMPVTGSNPPQAARDLASLTELHASEVWKVRSLIEQTEEKTTPSRFMVMDFMNVTQGRGLEYLMLEDEVAMPLHKERMNQESMAGWEVYSLIIPGGTEYGYNYATGNYFEHIDDVEFGFTEELIKQTMPGTDVAELLNTIYETRDLVKSEMWELITFAQ